MPISIDYEQFPSWSDYLPIGAWLPVLIFLAGIYVSVFRLRRPRKESIRQDAGLGSVLVILVLAIALFYQGASSNRSLRLSDQRAEEQGRGIKSIGTMLNYAADIPPTKVLDNLISKFSQPNQITPAQMSVLVHQIALFKSEIPSRVLLRRAKNNASNGSDYSVWYPIQEAFERNGIEPMQEIYLPSSLSETGILIKVPQNQDPPPYAEKLQAAFVLAGVTQAHLQKSSEGDAGDALIIQLAPPPI